MGGGLAHCHRLLAGRATRGRGGRPNGAELAHVRAVLGHASVGNHQAGEEGEPRVAAAPHPSNACRVALADSNVGTSQLTFAFRPLALLKAGSLGDYWQLVVVVVILV